MNYITKCLVILDNDATYATALARYIRTKRADISTIQVFTDVQMFLVYIRKNRISIAILGQSVSSLVKGDLIKADIPTIELVEETDNTNGLDLIYKYQSAKNILQSIDKRLIADGKQEKGRGELDNQIISILSPTGSPYLKESMETILITNVLMFNEKYK